MKKSTFKKIAFTAVAIACGSAFAQFNSNINLSKQSWSTHEGEAYFYVTPPFGELELSCRDLHLKSVRPAFSAFLGQH